MESGESHCWANHIDKICKVFEIAPEELVRSEKVVIGNISTNNGVGYAEVVNQLSEKLIEQYEEHIRELKQTISELINK